MKLFQHLDEEGRVLYEEVCHGLDSIEAWVNQHFGRQLPAGHEVVMSDAVAPSSEGSGQPAAPVTNLEGGDQNGEGQGNQDSGTKDQSPGSASPEARSPAGQEDPSQQDQAGSEQRVPAPEEGSAVRTEHPEEVENLDNLESTIEAKVYPDGSIATGPGPLPNKSPIADQHPEEVASDEHKE